jgi:hypothetical protein
MIVYDLDNGFEQVATYHCITTPEALAGPGLMMALYYNSAFVVPENNSAGRTFCIKMQETYDNSLLYHEDDWNPEKSRRTRAVGHRTTSANRDDMIARVAEAINDDSIVLHDKRTVAECKYFVYTKTGRCEAARGHHDDHVFATAKARYGLDMARHINTMKVKSRKNAATSYYQRITRQTADRSYV